MIRPYTSADKESLIELLQLNIPAYFHPEEKQDFVDYLAKHSEHYFVMEAGNCLVASGGINYGFDEGKTARLSWDIVHPDFQGQGFGGKLTAYRIEKLEENAQVEVVVVRTTQLVHGFYQKLGFELVRTEKDYWAPGFDLYYMEQQLGKKRPLNPE